MSDESSVQCPGCGKRHQWVQKFAGMRVRCTRCKGPMVMPYVPPRAPLPTEPVAATDPPPLADDAPPLLLDETEDSGLKLVEDSAPVIKATPAPKPVAFDSKADTTNEPAIPLDSAAGGDAPAIDPYELDIPEEIETGQAVELRTCPDCGVNIHANTVICVSCGTNVETGEKATIQTGIDERSQPPGSSPAKAAAGGVLADRPLLAALGSEGRRDDDPPNYAIDEIYIPVGLIVAGVILVLMDVFWILDTSLHLNDVITEPSSVQWRYLFQHAFATVFQVPFLFGGIFLIGIWFGTSFASWTEVILKLFAVAVFLSGFGGCIESFLDRITEGFGGMGFYMTASAEFAVFWGISAKLFDLDFIEVMILYFVAFFAPAIAVFFFFAMAYTMVFG